MPEDVIQTPNPEPFLGVANFSTGNTFPNLLRFSLCGLRVLGGSKNEAEFETHPRPWKNRDSDTK
jgi:hypothetical protein